LEGRKDATSQMGELESRKLETERACGASRTPDWKNSNRAVGA
jgi:hypothetical protein